MDGVPQDRLPQSGLQRIRKHQVDRALKQLFQKLHETHIGVKCWILQIDYKIKVARRRGLAARHRPDQAEASHPKAPDLLSMVSQRFQNRTSGVPSVSFCPCRRSHDFGFYQNLTVKHNGCVCARTLDHNTWPKEKGRDYSRPSILLNYELLTTNS